MNESASHESDEVGSTALGALANAGRRLGSSMATVSVLLGVMWILEVFDSFILGDRLQANGIVPRSVSGLDGILWAPFLHGGFPHLVSNSIPFVVLSGLVLTGGRRRYVQASSLIIVVGGLMVWAFAVGSNENHIGASGWVFGLLGFTIAAAVREKRPVGILAAVVAIVAYGGIIVSSFVPSAGISWEGHLFGFIAGLVAARVIVKKQALPSLDPPALG